MGMFDSVMVKCPECGEEIEFQSKAGECLCEVYPEENVPVVVAADISGEKCVCHKCQTPFTIFTELVSHVRVRGVRDTKKVGEE